MRSPQRKRPRRRVLAPRDSSVDWKSLAERVTYVGSPEHKDIPSFAGHPKPRADASICDRTLAQDWIRVEQWLRTAIRMGAVSEYRDGDFPRYAWYKDEGVVYEARLVNKGLGEYKGYPLNENEWPRGLDHVYD